MKSIPPPESESRQRTILQGCALLAMVCLVYLPVLHSGFIWDDNANVTDNLALRSLGGLKRIWFEPGATQQFYPLTYTSFWLDWRWFGLNPTGYHVENVLLHAFSAILLWRLLLRLRVRGAWLGAALFAVHPVCVESVAWVTERKNTLSGVFFLGSLIAATRFWRPDDIAPKAKPKTGKRGKTPIESATPGPWKFYWLALLLYIAALLAKTSTVGLPVVILLWLWWRQGKPGARTIGLLLPFFAAGLAMGLITMHVERTLGATTGELWAFSPAQRGLMAARNLWFYLGKLVFPWPLVFFYPRWIAQVSQPLAWLPVLAAVAALAWLWWKRKAGGKPALFVTGYFVVTLFPVLGFFNVAFFQFSVVSDHFQYLACIAPLALAGTGIAAVRKPAIGAALICILGALTWRQAGEYKSSEILWCETLARNPKSWTAHYNLGTALATKGDFAGGLREYTEAVSLDPGFANAHFSLGNYLATGGKLDEAIAEYNSVLAVKPDFTKVRNNLANALVRRGDFAGAATQYRLVLQDEPDNAEAHLNLGNILGGQGNFDEAVREYTRAIQVEPTLEFAHYGLGNALAGKGNLDRAIQEYREALRLNPELAEVHYNLANALGAKGNAGAAVEEYRLALKLKPDYWEARYNLANTLARQGNLDEAIAQYREIVRTRPDFADAQFNLANFLAARGRFAEAEPRMREALRINPKNPAAHYSLGMMLAQLRRFAEARNEFSAALRLKPDFVEARQQLELLNSGEKH